MDCVFVCVFFFKQKTAYEMRISDWSSDVCSSDLPALVRAIGGALTVFATLMARKGIESLEETANLLGIYAVLTDEIAPDEALILGCWTSCNCAEIGRAACRERVCQYV